MGRRCVCGLYCRLYVAYGECLLARAQIFELKGVNAPEVYIPPSEPSFPSWSRGLIFCCVSAVAEALAGEEESEDAGDI